MGISFLSQKNRVLCCLKMSIVIESLDKKYFQIWLCNLHFENCSICRRRLSIVKLPSNTAHLHEMLEKAAKNQQYIINIKQRGLQKGVEQTLHQSENDQIVIKFFEISSEKLFEQAQMEINFLSDSEKTIFWKKFQPHNQHAKCAKDLKCRFQ